MGQACLTILTTVDEDPFGGWEPPVGWPNGGGWLVGEVIWEPLGPPP